VTKTAEEKITETKKKKPSSKKPATTQSSGVSFALGDRARVKLGRS
jgi:hypothetical protein